jgi:nucleotide-binding universal stress UspA family protein
MEVVMKERMKILIGYDGSECADAAIDELRRAGLPSEATAIVLSVIEIWSLSPSGFKLLEGMDELIQIKATARRGADRVKSLMPGWEVESKMAVGSPASAILEKAGAWNPDLIVVGSHGRTAAGRFFFGSASMKLAHEAHTTVRIARARREELSRPLRIIIGVDGSKGSEEAVNLVASRHWPENSEARIVHACWRIPTVTSEPMLNRIAGWVAEEQARVKVAINAAIEKLGQAGLRTSVVVKEEEPKALLLNEAESWNADCIFVGARGMGRVERFLIGSVSSAVAARAHCSVEVVRIA